MPAKKTEKKEATVVNPAAYIAKEAKKAAMKELGK